MNQQIAAIEAAAGNPVYVGGITGARDSKQINASVRHNGQRVEIVCPGATPEAAVAALFQAVCE